MLRAVFGFSFLVLAMSGTTSDASSPERPPQPKIHPAGIPANAMRLSPCIATMGEHWGDPKGSRLGPFYGVWQGKPVFSEIMISVSSLDKGFSYKNLRALPGYTIDHFDLDFEPHGHPGFLVPHYDLHVYYVSPETQAKICPNGVPDSAMKPMPS